MHMRSAVALSLLVLLAVPTHAGSASAPYPLRHMTAPELLSADDLNAMVLNILSGQPQPVLDGSGTRQQEMQAAWGRLRGLLGGARTF